LEYKAVAATLNVLDYETYFRFTEMLLQGDYVNALLEYDSVLTKGFSGQIFMAGLNQHFRDLMMARGAGISLIEYTGTLLEKYRAQAAKCDGAFLFGAISLLTEADSKLRTATSQRLLVELTLMKISALGQKKNDDLELSEPTTYALPNLNEVRAAQPQPSVASTPQPQPAPQPTVAPAPQVEPKQVVAEPQPTVAPAPTPQPQVVEPTPTPAPTPTPSPTPASEPMKLKGSILGGSLRDIMEKASSPAEHRGGVLGGEMDPDSENKLFRAKEKIISCLSKERVRIAAVFESIDFRDNKLLLVVPTEGLRAELIDMRFDILKTVAEVAGINGALEMVIEVKEVEYKLKPVKLEDRIEHMYKAVPELGHLQKSLDIIFD
jgi:DNA polymerase-3 subunit gamma/tau